MVSNLQISENKTIDARSFVEIYSECTERERVKMTNKITKLLECSGVAVWNYGKGNYSPNSLSAKKDIVRAIKSVLKINTTPETLFPSK